MKYGNERNWFLHLISMCFAQAMVPPEGGQEAASTTRKKPESVTITMSDGRQVEFVGKRKMLKRTVIEGGRVGIEIDFRNGETRKYWAPDALLLQFAGHGMEQKYGDETAGEDDVDDMVLAVDALDQRIQAGEWRVAREPGSSMSGTSVLMQALIEVSGKSKEDVKAFLSTKSQAEKTALRNSDKLRPVVQRIEAEKAAKANKVDTDSLLGEIGL